jgi:hypothetical protein
MNETTSNVSGFVWTPELERELLEKQKKANQLIIEREKAKGVFGKVFWKEFRENVSTPGQAVKAVGKGISDAFSAFPYVLPVLLVLIVLAIVFYVTKK